jgi:hypothetical protein
MLDGQISIAVFAGHRGRIVAIAREKGARRAFFLRAEIGAPEICGHTALAFARGGSNPFALAEPQTAATTKSAAAEGSTLSSESTRSSVVRFVIASIVAGSAACGASSKEAKDPTTDVRAGALDGARDLGPGGEANSTPANTSSAASAEERSTRGTKGKTSATDGTPGLTPSGAGGGSGCGCVRTRVAWGLDGGLVPFRETNALERCATFTHERTTGRRPPLTCRQELDACSSDVAAVAALLLRPDILMVTALAPVFYGEDTRPADGQVLRLDIGGAVIDVGEPCRSSACKPIPDSIATLGAALRAISKRELARGACGEAFPPQ